MPTLAHLLLALAPLLPGPVTTSAAPAASESSSGPTFITPPARKALVIGTNANERQGKLRFAESDAIAFADTLWARFGFTSEHLRLLVDGAADAGDRPTAGNMYRHLRELLAEEAADQSGAKGPSDLFVFYFAGHGVGTDDGDYLLPMDGVEATAKDVGLPVRDVIREFVSAGVGNVLFVVDACRTGGENPFGEELWQLAEQADLSLILACEPGEISNEDTRLNGGDGGGVFTAKLIEVLDDPGTLEGGFGALWASDVSERAAEAVTAYTSRGFGGAQHPRIWTDPTRDVLLGTALVDLDANPDLTLEGDPAWLGFLEQANGLDEQDYLDALAAYADTLYQADRFAECAELLGAAAELGAFGPYFLYLYADCLQYQGRHAEMVRVQKELLQEFPDSYEALVVLAHDLSGETPASVRYEASWRMWTEWPVYTVDEAMLIIFNLHNGGPPERVREVLAEVLPKVDPQTRQGAYLGFIDLLLNGTLEDALALLERAEDLPGDYPGNDRFRQERYNILLAGGDPAALDALIDRCIADWPEDPIWRVRRALARQQRGEWEGALADARACLEAGLADPSSIYPWVLLDAVQAAGIRAQDLIDLVEPLAATMPLSWKAGMAYTFCLAQDVEDIFAIEDPDERQAAIDAHVVRVQEATDAAKRLAPGLGVWSAEIGRIKYTQLREAYIREGATHAEYTAELYDLFHTLAERAGEFQDEEAGWEVLVGVGQELDRHHQLAELVRAHLGDRIEAAVLPPELIDLLSVVLLSSGDLEGFHAVQRSMEPDTVLARSFRWYELAWLLCADREAEALELLAVAPVPPPGMAQVATWARHYLAVRGLLEGMAPPTVAELEALDPLIARGEIPGQLEAALAILTWEQLDRWDLAQPHLGVLLNGPSGKRALIARIAAWKALLRHADDDLELRHSVVWDVGHGALGIPEADAISFLPGSTVDDFRGVYELVLGGGGGELTLPLADVLLTVRRGGKLTGVLEGRPDEGGVSEVWSLSGTIDAFGNVRAELKGADRPARVWLKLPPPDLLEEIEPLVTYGIKVMLLDDANQASTWGLFVPR